MVILTIESNRFAKISGGPFGVSPEQLQGSPRLQSNYRVFLVSRAIIGFSSSPEQL